MTGPNQVEPERTPPNIATPARDEHGPLSRSRMRREAITAGADPVPPDDTTTTPVTAEGSYDWWRAEVARRDEELERLRADVAAAYAERDEMWERKVAALQRAGRAEAERDALKAAVLYVAAEAHRRKWVWEDTSPSAFEELHRIGNELLAALPAPESLAPAHAEDVRILRARVGGKLPPLLPPDDAHSPATAPTATS